MNVAASDGEAYAAVRKVFDAWADAVQRCDIEATVAPHTRDVLLFDVPASGSIVKGIEAYRESFRDFFPFIADGGVFEITDLDIVAGTDVAFAHCIVRCGRQADDTFPVRLTVSFRKIDGEWRIAHEHHSVAAKD